MHCKQDPERLRPGLDSGRPQVVRAAVRIVTETGSPRAIELLTPLLSRGSAEVKLDVIEALVKLRDPRLVFHLQPLLEDEDGRVRTAVIASWSGADPDAAARPLLAILEDEHFAERPHGEKATLFRVLGQLGGERVIRAMERVLFAQPRGLMVSIAVQVGIIALAGAGMTAGLVVGLGTGLGLAVGLGIVVATIVGIVGRAALARTRHTEFIEPAAMCLRAVGDEDALAVLREAAEKGPGKTRRICNRVMKIAATRGTE